MKFKNKYELTEVDDGFVAVPIDQKVRENLQIIRLNQSGAEIWRCIQDGKSPEEIVDELSRKYDNLNPELASSYVQEVVEKLIQGKVIES